MKHQSAEAAVSEAGEPKEKCVSVEETAVVLPPPGRAGAQGGGAEAGDDRCARQREVCVRLLERWVPLATAAELALRKEGRSGPVIDEEPFEAGLKAGAFVLKVLERLARLDGLDAAEKREAALVEPADPLELARRVRAVSPVLAAKLGLAGQKGVDEKPE